MALCYGTFYILDTSGLQNGVKFIISLNPPFSGRG